MHRGAPATEGRGNRAIVPIVDTNDLMRRIRYAVRLDDADTARLVALGGGTASAADAAAWREREGEPAHRPCPGAALAALLDGLVLERRGPPPPGAAAHAPAEITSPFDNNRVLRQLRVALELQTDEVLSLIAAGGGQIGKSELGALFRKPGTRNYRPCGDQVLRRFLTGLAARRPA